MATFPFYKQLDSTDCGLTCLRMISKYYGKELNYTSLNRSGRANIQGISFLALKQNAQEFGFNVNAVKLIWADFVRLADRPCIIHWNKNHFVVVYKIKQRIIKGEIKYTLYICDPGFGKIKYTKEEFLKRWSIGGNETRGCALFLYPGEKFGEINTDKNASLQLRDFIKYLKPYYFPITQFFLTMLLASVISLFFPFLTQAIVDIGIEGKDLNFILLLLIAQLLLTLGQVANDMIRSWLMLHMTTKISISFISDFLFKLVKLPISFFDVKKVGDIIQRIGDNTRIQNFLTGTLISMIITTISFIVYTIIMAGYHIYILLIFITGSIFYVTWITFFLRKRRELDKKNFEVSSANQSNIIELVSGMQEIKLNGCEKRKLWEWEKIQSRLYHINIKSLALDQAQNIGGTFINQIKNIIISYMAAKSVVHNEMTLGMMMAMQYIIGQLNAPLMQFISFIGSTQDAKISLERLSEIYSREDEEPENSCKQTEIPEASDIIFQNVTFQYNGPESSKVLNNLSFQLYAGKMNAIVGISGSGKTTLLKLLLGFYTPTSGEIKLAGQDLYSFSDKKWRSKCGVVMQEGYIFNDTILRNIAVGDETPDMERFMYAIKVANIEHFINSLPLGLQTIIGSDGIGISTGQKQRILIARAVYKNPSYIFLDEATNSLDMTNEKIILDNLDQFFSKKTVMIIAHRLSTVKNADHILVLDKGHIVESGNHHELLSHKGLYYNLIKDQIELNKVQNEN